MSCMNQLTLVAAAGVAAAGVAAAGGRGRGPRIHRHVIITIINNNIHKNNTLCLSYYYQ